MYYIDSVSNNYNYDENVVLTMLFAKSEDGKEIYSKPISQDKSEDEMSSFVQQWSLTTLSVTTGISADELKKEFGTPFKRCYVRPVHNEVFYHRDEMNAHLVMHIHVSLNGDFTEYTQFFVESDNPLTDEFVKELKIKSLAGFKSI